jgi:hypothetical protein
MTNSKSQIISKCQFQITKKISAEVYTWNLGTLEFVWDLVLGIWCLAKDRKCFVANLATI